MPGGPAPAPGTPNSKVQVNFQLNKFKFTNKALLHFQDVAGRIKVVVALYPFKAIENGDLSLEKVNMSLNNIIVL